MPAYLNAKDVWGEQEGSEIETEDRKHEACEDRVNHKRVETEQYLVQGTAGQSGLGGGTEDRAGRGENWRRGLGSKSNCEQRVSRQLADSGQYLQVAGTGQSGSTEMQGWQVWLRVAGFEAGERERCRGFSVACCCTR